MRIQLGQEEIITGIKMYLTSVGVNSYGKEVKVDFTSTRKPGAGGLIADVDITFVPATVIPGGLITREYAPEFRGHDLASAPDTASSVLLQTSAVSVVSSDGDLEVHSSGSILDEVLAGVDSEKVEPEPEPEVVHAQAQVSATASLFDPE